MRIGFMGSPDFSVPTLEVLHNSTHSVEVVYTQPPRPKGRGKKIIPCPVHEKADALDIPVLNPTKFNDDEVEILKSYNLDLLVVVAYGIILPQKVLDIPKYGCINGHASLLPRWRGAAPIQRAIQSGDEKTGVCIMKMDSGLDTGDVISEFKVDISKDMNSKQLHDKLMIITADEIIKVVDNITNINLTLQSSQGVTYADKLYKNESNIDWSKNAVDIYNTVRAFNPFPLCSANINSSPIKVISCELFNKKTDKPAGTILSDNPLLVACGDGQIINITKLQKAGKKEVSIKDFLNGNNIVIGENIFNN